MVRRRQPPPLASSEHYRVKAVEQTLAILDVLAESPDLALPEIAERIGLATPNAHKLILHLQEAGLVETGLIDKRYRLGARRLAELTERALATVSHWEAFRASVPALHVLTGMHGLVAKLVGSRVVYVEQTRGPDLVAGRAFPAHATALGKGPPGRSTHIRPRRGGPRCLERQDDHRSPRAGDRARPQPHARLGPRGR